MENLTHTLVGVMLSRAGLNRHREGEKRFGLMMALAANAPDIDTYPFLYDMLDYLEIHRGPTHAFAFLPLVALVPIAIVWAINRKRPAALLYWWFASMVAVLSHLLLDWTNVYGIRLFLPFTGDWLHLDITSVLDPFIWLILLSAVAFPALSGLVGSEIRGRAERTPKQSWAWIALLLLASYEGSRWWSHQQATDMLNARLYDGQPAEHVHAFPSGLLPTTWRTVAEVENDGESIIYEDQLDITAGYDPQNSQVAFPADPASQPVQTALASRTFQVLESFNQVPFWRIRNSGVDRTIPGYANAPTTYVELVDLRFSSSREGGGLTATAELDDRGDLLSARFGFGNSPPETGQ